MYSKYRQLIIDNIELFNIYEFESYEQGLAYGDNFIRTTYFFYIKDKSTYFNISKTQSDILEMYHHSNSKEIPEDTLIELYSILSNNNLLDMLEEL